MKFLYLLFIPFLIIAQNREQQKDTSFTFNSTIQKVLKDFPNAKPVKMEEDFLYKKNITYKKIGERKLLLDLFLQNNKIKKPAVILIHGGGWRSGNKSMEKKSANELAKLGYAAIPIEYRLSPEAKYPAAVEDIYSAIDYVIKNSSLYNIDKNKIALMGESAGGHLASLVGIKYNQLKNKKVIKAVINFDGVMDMTTPSESGKDTIPDKPSSGKQWLGYSFAEKPELWKEVSPVNFIDENSPTFLFVNSSIDRFHAGRDESISQLNKYDIYSEVHEIKNTPHTFWLFHPWFDEAIGYVEKFLNKTLIKNQINISGNKWSERIIESFVKRNPKYIVYDENPTMQKWNYEQGLMLNAFRQMYYHTNNKFYFEYIKNNLDQNVQEDGSITTYKVDEYNIDQIGPGRALLFTYQMTKNEKYKKAADLLFHQLKTHPRTKSGGFWHKQIYPWQMWLDGLYMGAPFYTEYSLIFNQPKNYEDIIHQFELIYEKTYDKKTGLLYHAWDESKEQLWANKETGQSPHFWGRAIGWYMMAIVDVLDYLPKDYKKRNSLIEKLKTLSSTLMKFRDEKTKCWYQIIDLPDRKPNYVEASATAMFVYSFAKGVNKGYLDKKFLQYAYESWKGILKEFVNVDKNGLINLEKTCQGAGLGGKPYRDGSFEYYMSEKVRTNDYKGYGPFLLSSIELERAGILK
ncbi:MAG: glycoside hydrolase family 88 protein [Melioribacteraceae bacterium]|nr:glycoside hydrolase family 88 protein [Melioribacteraceae bacterium]